MRIKSAGGKTTSGTSLQGFQEIEVHVAAREHYAGALDFGRQHSKQYRGEGHGAAGLDEDLYTLQQESHRGADLGFTHQQDAFDMPLDHGERQSGREAWR